MSNRYIHEATGLKNLIAENPNLPIVALADGNTSCLGDDMWWLQSVFKCDKGLILDYELDWTDKIYMSDDDLEEDLSEYLCDNYEDLEEKEFEELVQEKLKTYEKYWREVIVVKVSN